MKPEELALQVAKSMKSAKAANLTYEDWMQQNATDKSDDYSTVWAAIK